MQQATAALVGAQLKVCLLSKAMGPGAMLHRRLKDPVVTR